MKKFGKWKYFEYYNYGIIGKRIMRRNSFTQWLYAIIPFLLTMILFIAMQLDGALFMGENDFSFFKDISNSFCMVALLILAYFFSGIYPLWVKQSVNILISYVKDDGMNRLLNKVTKVMHTLLIFCIPLSAIAFPLAFIESKLTSGWMAEVTILTYGIYLVYLMFTWYLSACLLLYAVISSYIIKRILSHYMFNLFAKEYELIKCEMQEVAKTIGATVSFGVFYFIGTIIMIVLDNINYARDNNIDMMFHSYPIVAIILVFLIFMGFIYTLLPAIEYYNVIKSAKTKKLKEILKIKDKDEKEKEKVKLNMISASVFESGLSRVALILSVIGPFVSLVVQMVTT